ncbi:sensor histidine kinase [Sphingomonas adhaesiva]|uniref:sensor histidine kinase n=1 Tax=Sphingomonas adhaesiva TaxID=28212 RepID=UPI002FF5FF0B
MPRSLYARMLAIAIASTTLALVIAGVVIAGVLGRFVTEGLDRRLDATLLVLASAVDRDGRVDRARLGERVAALEGGPAWRWRIVGPDGAVASADFPPLHGAPSPPPPPPPPGGPGGAQVLEGAGGVHARTVTLPTRRGPVVLTAAAPREVVQRPIRGALLPLLVALAAVALLLTVAMLVQLRVGLRPLRRVRDQVAAMRAGRRDRIDGDQPAELLPLTVELNALAADNAAALATARASAANLAHALKTPVATLALDLRDQPRAAALVGRIDRTIRHHLTRARAAAIDRRSATPLRPAIDGVAGAIPALRSGRLPEVSVPAELTVAMDAQDLDELLGNLLDNAARHARSRVAVRASREGRSVVLTIADDGPGIPADERALVARAGTRLDEAGDGHGFGLWIVAELAALYGGAMQLDEAPGGGLSVRMVLPAA